MGTLSVGYQLGLSHMTDIFNTSNLIHEITSQANGR